MYHQNMSAKFVQLRRTLPSAAVLPSGDPEDLVLAVAYLTANPQTTLGGVQNAKLLGAYKFWINDNFVGVGPGRVGTCGPVCPVQNVPSVCDCTPEHVYDWYNVTALLRSAATNQDVVLAIQGYHAGEPSGNLPPKLWLHISLHYRNGSEAAIVSDPVHWKAWQADDYLNPTCCASAYGNQPYQVTAVARLPDISRPVFDCCPFPTPATF
jgi:hypothetical protein